MSAAVVGIDPGLSGALAVFQEDGEVRVYDAPVVAVAIHGKRRVEYDVSRMAQELTALRAFQHPALVVLEQAAPHPKDGKIGWQRCGRATALWEGLLAGLDVPYRVVHPATWKRAMGLTGLDKQAVRLRAAREFPGIELSRVKDHNRAEALYLAVYARRLLGALGGKA